MTNDAPDNHWIDDACKTFDAYAKDFGWNSHIYSERLRALVTERDALRAENARFRSALKKIERQPDYIIPSPQEIARAALTKENNDEE